MVKVIATGSFDAFIIPNDIRKLDELFSKAEARKTAELNGLNPEDQKYVQIWIVGTDGQTDNLADHGIVIDADRIDYTSTWIPVKIFNQLKEGDSVKNLHVYGWGYSRLEGIEERDLFDLELPEVKLAQGKYRYKEFGNGKFDEVLKNLIDRAA